MKLCFSILNILDQYEFQIKIFLAFLNLRLTYLLNNKGLNKNLR